MKRNKAKKYRRVHQVEVAYTDKPITAWGGMAVIIGKFLERIRFRTWVEASFPIHETSPNAKGVYPKILAQFLTALVGGQRFAHLSWWGHGLEAILQTFNVAWLPTDASVLTRFWSKVSSRAVAERVGEAARGFVRQTIKWEGLVEDNLNLDSTVFVRYGRQEGVASGYNPNKKKRGSHHPILAFLGSGYVANLWNRTGNAFSANNAEAFFRQTIAALGKDFRVRRVLCDSGFFQVKFLRYLEKEGFRYIIAVRFHGPIKVLLAGIAEWRTVDKGIEVAEFEYEHRTEKGSRPRRYVAVRQKVSLRPKATGKQLRLFENLFADHDWRYSVFVTNDPDLSPEEAWSQYRTRANDENVLKDLVEGYGIAAFNLRGFWATEAVMVMNALVFHNLIHCLNRNVLNKNRPRDQLKTLRSKYFILPAQLGGGARRSILRLAARGRSLRGKLDYFMAQIEMFPGRLNSIAVET